MNTSSDRSLLTGFAVALCILVALGVLQYWMSFQLVQSNRWVTHTDEVLTKIETVLSDTSGAESAVRGYVIDGDAARLVRYRSAANAVTGDLDELKTLVSDNAAQEQRANDLQRVIDSRLAALQKVVDLRKQAGLEAVQSYHPVPSGTEIMKQVSTVASQMAAEETRLERLRSNAADERARQTSGLILIGTVAAIAALCLAALVVRRDATERRRILNVVEETRRLYEGLFEAAADAFLLTDFEGRIVDANAEAARLFGYARAELAGQPVDALVPERFRGMHWTDRQSYYSEPSTRLMGTRRDIFGRRKDGSEFPADIMLNIAHAGNRRLVLSTVRDVTERKRSQEDLTRYADELSRSNIELARSNTDLKNFAYVASHDLQEPLRMVSSYTRLLGERYRGKLDAEADEFIAHAVDGAARMQALIQDLLNYSRVTRQAPRLEPVDCREVVQRALLNLQGTIQESGAEIIVDRLPVVKGDTSQLVQLFQNLLGNAIKFRGDRKPLIEVSATKGADWTFCVRDNGIGIEPQNRERIFAMFQRLHTRQEYPGTGIGLAVCKRIVEAHGGRLWVESEPGRGSSFFFTMPA